MLRIAASPAAAQRSDDPQHARRQHGTRRSPPSGSGSGGASAPDPICFSRVTISSSLTFSSALTSALPPSPACLARSFSFMPAAVASPSPVEAGTHPAHTLSPPAAAADWWKGARGTARVRLGSPNVQARVTGTGQYCAHCAAARQEAS